MEVPPRMAYWLVPKEPWLGELQQAVLDFANRFNGPRFEPHATIYSGPFDRLDPVETILDELAEFDEVKLLPRELLFSAKFKESCYIKFEDSVELLEMCRVVKKHIHLPLNYEVVPHMSLFYGQLTLEQQNTISRDFKFPESIKFDFVKVIANPPNATSCSADVEYWNERARRRLDSLGKTTSYPSKL